MSHYAVLSSCRLRATTSDLHSERATFCFEFELQKINQEEDKKLSLIPVASLRAPRFETCSGWKTPAKHSSVSSPAPNKTSIACGARPTCAPPLRCAGPLGCHGHPPLTCRRAPRVRCGGGEGRRLSPRPLRRSGWPPTGSRSQRAPSPSLRDGGGQVRQVRGHAERVGAESRQTHMVPRAQESASLN